MAVELSTGNRCLQAFHQTGFDPEDKIIARYAKLQRVVANIIQGWSLSAATAASVWGYNDPTREDEEPVPLFVYISAASGGALWAAVNAIFVKRFFQNRLDKPSLCMDPLFAPTIVSGSAFATLGIAYLKALEMSNSIKKLKQEYEEATQEHYKQDDECDRDVFEKRNSFTNPDCTVCDLQIPFRDAPTFYQARPKDWFSEVVCLPTILNYEDVWKSLHNISMNSSQEDWPCGDIYYFGIDNRTEYNSLTYIARTLGIYPPMEVVVSEINETCKLLNATGVEISMISSSLCIFHRSYETICTNEAWKNYSTLYLESDFVMPEYHDYYQQDPVSKLLSGDNLSPQLAVFGPALLLSFLGIFARFLASKWRYTDARAEPPLEMVTLQAEGSESED